MPRPAKPLAHARATLLREVAAEAFARKGYEGASLNDVLQRAGMGKSSFYHHFVDKAALHDWVTRGLSAALVKEIQPPRLAELTAERYTVELSLMLARASHVAVKQPTLMDLGRMFHNSGEMPRESAIAGVRRRVTEWVTEALAVGRGLGIIRADLPIELLTAWTISSLTVIDQWTLTATVGPDARRRATETSMASLWQLLTGSGGTRTS